MFYVPKLSIAKIYSADGRGKNCEYGVPEEWYWWDKTEVFWEKSVPVPSCSPKISHKLVLYRTQASVLTGQRLRPWDIALSYGDTQSGVQEMFGFSWDPKSVCCVQKNLPPVRTMCHLTQIQTLTTYVFKINNIFLHVCFQTDFLLSISSIKVSYAYLKVIPVAPRSKAWVCGRLLAGIVRSNPAEGHGRLSVVSVVCSQVEVSASGWSLIQRSSTECDREASIMRVPWPTRGYCALGKKMQILFHRASC